MSRETKEGFYREQLHELELARLQFADRNCRRMVKDLERAKKRLETRLQLLMAENKKDNTLTFEELGVDRLFVDEAQNFKNLFYVTKMTRVAGLPQSASERAFDMFLKVSHVQRVNGGGGVVFATGTPVTNSMAEMFAMQRYLQMAALRAQRLNHFDSWAATFGEPVTAMELSPDGAGYRLQTRFARFIKVNLAVSHIFHIWQVTAEQRSTQLVFCDTYAEVKAIASGNPLVIEKAAIDAELMRLTRLRSQHHETQYRIRSQIRHLTEEIPLVAQRIENLRQDIAARTDTQGDNFSMLIDGQQCDNRGVAGELILRRAETCKRTRTDHGVGKLGGFDVCIRVNFMGHTELLVKGRNTYAASLAETALGTIRSLEHTIQTLDEKLPDQQKQLEDCRRRIQEFQEKVGQPFEYEQKLGELEKRQEEIVQALDLNKNQAPDQLDATPNEDNEETVEHNQTMSAEETVRTQAPVRRRSHGVRV